MDGVLDDVVRPPVGVDESDAVSAVGVNQVVDDQGVRVSSGYGDAAVAFAAAVIKDAVSLNVDRLAAGAADGESADGYEFGLLELDGISVGANRACAA